MNSIRSHQLDGPRRNSVHCGESLKDSRASVECPARISRDQYARQQLESLADKLPDGSLVPFITHLMEVRKISAKERREIRKLLDRHK